MDELTLNAVRREQDARILVAVRRFFPRSRRLLERPGLDSLIYSRLSNGERSALSHHQPLPIIVPDADAQARGLFLDPPRVGEAPAVSEALLLWGQFIDSVFEQYGSISQEEQVSYYGEAYLGTWFAMRALREAYHSHGYAPADLLGLIDCLWAHRSIVDVNECARMRTGVVASFGDELGDEPERVWSELEQRLEAAREKAMSIDEWLEDLYLLSPLASYLYRYYWQSTDEDGRRRHRFVDEIYADIGTIFFHCVRAVIEQNSTAWTDAFLARPLTEAADKRAFKRALSYRYRARIFYPRFWYETALDAATAGGPPPSILNEFDPQRALSIAYTRSPRVTEDRHFLFDDLVSS
jgi:hypothetical protein